MRKIPRSASPLVSESTAQLQPVEAGGYRDILLALQHVLVMYAGTIAVPLIVGSALHLSKDQLAYLINADLLAAGLVTIIQSIGIPGIGIRLPIMMGVTFAAVSPMIAIAQNPHIGLQGLFGAVIAAGIFGLLVAPWMGRLIRLFPPVVTGTVICLIGLSLLKVGINWSAGGQPFLTQTVQGQTLQIPNPEYGQLSNLAMAFGVLVFILILSRFGKGLVKNIAVLMGLLLGSFVSYLLGRVDLQELQGAPWFALTTPFHFGLPTFDLSAALSLSLVMLIILVESIGMFLVIGELMGKSLTEADLTRGLRADGLGAVIGGIFNTFPYTSFSQNVGLLTVTQVRSPRITALGGVLLMGLGLLPKAAVLAASIPPAVLGGAGLVMFGMVAATGIRILASVDYQKQQQQLFVIALSLTVGMIPTLVPQFFQHLPAWTQTFTHSGIIMGAITAVSLNLFFHGPTDPKEIFRMTADNMHGVEP